MALSYRAKVVSDWLQCLGLPLGSLRLPGRTWSGTLPAWFHEALNLGCSYYVEEGQWRNSCRQGNSAFGFVPTVLTAALGSPQSPTSIPGSIKPMSGLRAWLLSNSLNRAVYHHLLSSVQQHG